jgi:hypothetical protein
MVSGTPPAPTSSFDVFINYSSRPDAAAPKMPTPHLCSAFSDRTMSRRLAWRRSHLIVLAFDEERA